MKVTGTLGHQQDGNDYDYAGAIANADTLIFDQSANQILSGELTGDGTLVKEGTGDLILNDASGDSVVGAVEVEAGKFIVGDENHKGTRATFTATNGVTVNNGALLGGHGIITGEVSIGSGGILSPGNSYGHLTIVGNVTLEEGAWFYPEISFDAPDEGDLLKVKGTVSLSEGATVQYVTIDDGTNTYASEGEWRILEVETGTGTIEGRFNKKVATDIDFAFLSSALSYRDWEGEKIVDENPQSVYLSLTRLPFGDHAQTGNESAVAGALESLDPESCLFRQIVGTVTREQARPLLNELSGEIHATLKSHLLMRESAFLRQLNRRALDTNQGLWISANHARQLSDSDGNAERARWEGAEITGGYDTARDDGRFGGLAFRLHDGRLDVDRRRSEMKITSGAAAIYGGKEWSYAPGSLRLLLTGTLSAHRMESERKVRIGTSGQKLEANYDGQILTGAIETAYRFPPTEKLRLEPYAALAWHELRLDGFREKSACVTERDCSAALRKKKETRTYATSTVGMRFTVSPREDIIIDADVGWRHLFGNATPKNTFAFESGSDRFTIHGTPKNKDAALLGLSIGTALTKNTRLSLQYDGELGSRERGHEGRLVLEVRW